MASAPIFVGTPKVWMQQLTTANTGRDGTGTLGTVVTAGSSGSRISSVRAFGVGTVTAGVVRLFLNDGTNKRLIREILVPATTPSATVEGWYADVVFPDGLVLPSGWSLIAATNNSETFNIFAFGGDI